MNLNRLVMILEAELLNYQELFEYEQKKAQLIIASEAERLVDLISREETVVIRLRSLEEQRQQYLASWQVCYQLPNLPSLLQIAQMSAEDPLSQQVSQLRKDLLDICKSLGRQNRSNEALAKQAIHHSQKLFAILTGTNESLAYKEGGGRAELRKKVLLDQSI